MRTSIAVSSSDSKAEGRSRGKSTVVSRPAAGAAILPTAIEFATNSGGNAREAGPD